MLALASPSEQVEDEAKARKAQIILLDLAGRRFKRRQTCFEKM